MRQTQPKELPKDEYWQKLCIPAPQTKQGTPDLGAPMFNQDLRNQDLCQDAETWESHLNEDPLIGRPSDERPS